MNEKKRQKRMKQYIYIYKQNKKDNQKKNKKIKS